MEEIGCEEGEEKGPECRLVKLEGRLVKVVTDKLYRMVARILLFSMK